MEHIQRLAHGLSVALLVGLGGASSGPAVAAPMSEATVAIQEMPAGPAEMPLELEPGLPGAAAVKALIAQASEAPTEADRAFLEPLLILFDRSARVPARAAAAARLAELGDERAVVPLLYAIQDVEPEVQLAVVEALGRFVQLAVEETLARVLQDKEVPERVRAAAARSLGAQRTERARDVLYEVYRKESVPRIVRAGAGEALEASFPGYLASRGESGQVIDRRGRYLLVPAGAAFGAYALGTVGRFGKAAASVPIGVASGIVLGGTSAFLLTQRQEMTWAQAGYITSGGGWGLWTGLTLGRLGTWDRCGDEDELYEQAAQTDNWAALDAFYECEDQSTDILMGAGLIGQAAGLLATGLTAKDNPFTFGDLVTINLGGLAAHNAIWGIELLAGDNQISRGELAGVLGGSLAGLAGAGLIARQTRFSSGDVTLVAQGALQGAWIGGWAPSLGKNTNDDDTGGGILLGSSLGMVGAAWLAQHVDFRVGDNLFMSASSAYGYLLGAGLPQLFIDQYETIDERVIIGSMLTAGVAALGGAITLREQVQFDWGDVALTGATTGIGLWHGLAIPASTKNPSGTQMAGSALTGMALGGLGGMAFSQHLSLSPWEVLMLTSGGMWGAWFGLWGNLLAESEVEQAMLTTLLLSDLGLGTSALLLSPLVGVHPTRVGWANVGGLSGATLASLVAALASSDRDVIITANLLGSVVGLGAGAFVGSRVKVDRPKRHAGRAALALNRLLDWQPSISVAPNLAPSGPGSYRSDGWLIQLSGRQPVRR